MPRFHPIAAVALPCLLVAAGAAAPAHAARFQPRVSASVTDHHVRKGSHPGLAVTIRQKRGEAALSSVSVLLPRELRPSIDTLKRTCSLAAVTAGQCTKASVLGSAVAVSSTLKAPLRGPIVLAEPLTPPEGDVGIGLPDLSVALRGGGVSLTLRGQQRLGSTGRLRTLFRDLPPVPVQRFTLRFASLREGPLEAALGLCGRRLQRLDVRLTSADGRHVRRTPRLRVPCG